MEINGNTRLCGLIGNPVGHTLSPVIHNMLAEKLSHNLVYVPFFVEQGGLSDAVKGAYELNVLGLNVTVPYKSDVISCLKEVDGLAEKIGAVNTLVRTEGGYKGYNTDISGLYRAMQEEGMELAGKKVVLLGAGGAARAAAFLCGEKKVRELYILNRSFEKAELLAGEVKEAFGDINSIPMAMQEYEKLPEEKMIVIQGTSVGLYPHTREAVLEDPAFYRRTEAAFDLIYKPAETRFMQLAREAGAAAFNGLKMLLYQGITAYELWNQVTVSKEESREIYEALEKAVHPEKQPEREGKEGIRQ